MSPRGMLRLTYAVAIVLTGAFLLMGLAFLPERPLYGVIGFWLVPFMLLLWAQSDRSRIGRTVAGLHGGIWFVVFGFLLIPYYLWSTREHRTWPQVVAVLAALIGPIAGYNLGLYSAPWLQIRPRYVQLDVNGPSIRVTPEVARQVVARDFDRITRFIVAERRRGRIVPSDVENLYDRFFSTQPMGLALTDPYSGSGYYYASDENDGFGLYSVGPDGVYDTDDDSWLAWWPDSSFTNVETMRDQVVGGAR